MKLSILIPVYQENCIKLVSDLVNQTKRLSIDSEILVFDDCSPIKCEDNRTLSDMERVTYRELEQNIGRSKIRNLLADTASGDVLIFLDGDSGIVREDFIQKYIGTIQTADVVRGGTTY
ncbi:MAG: glycosyltransferase, partial [Bacteroidales bacterium]|nr:glycosyltransferase [Bacteroidales bacterium]